MGDGGAGAEAWRFELWLAEGRRGRTVADRGPAGRAVAGRFAVGPRAGARRGGVPAARLDRTGLLAVAGGRRSAAFYKHIYIFVMLSVFIMILAFIRI